VAGGTYAIYQYDQKISMLPVDHPGYSKNAVLFCGKQWGGFFFPPALTLGFIFMVSSPITTWKKIGFELSRLFYIRKPFHFRLKLLPGEPDLIIVIRLLHFISFRHSTVRITLSCRSCGLCIFRVDSTFINANSTVLKILAYVPAVLCATERIYNKQHWASDCFFGAALGTFTGIFVVKQHKRKIQKFRFLQYILGNENQLKLKKQL